MTHRRPARASLFTPAFITLSLAELAYFTAAGLTIPITPLFAHGPLGASALGVGVAVGAFSVTALVLRPYAGGLSDRVGRRPLLVGGALLCGALLAAHVLVDQLAVLIVLRLLLGVAEAFFFVAGFAAVADLAPEGRTGEAISFNSLSLYLGIALGPLVGQVLVDAGGYGMAWIGGAAIALTGAVLAWRMPETRQPSVAPGGPRPLINRAALAPSLALFAGIAGMSGFLAFVAIHATENLRLEGAGGILFLFGIVVVGTRVLFARLPDRVPPFRLGAFALALSATGLLVASWGASVAGLVVGTIILPLVSPSRRRRCSPPSSRGSIRTARFGIRDREPVLDLAFGGGPVVLGLVAGVAGSRQPSRSPRPSPRSARQGRPCSRSDDARSSRAPGPDGVGARVGPTAR
jgi:predicted MFS family arabinose efflux permease